MATVKIDFGPRDAVPATTNGAQHDALAGTNFTVPILAFDAGTAETAYFYFRALNYGSGEITVKAYWYADTASSGDVAWAAQLAAITPDTDTQDIETKAFTTAATFTDSHLGTTGQRLHVTSAFTIPFLDSLAADDWVCLLFRRDAASGADTMAGDALLVGLVLTYSDT